MTERLSEILTDKEKEIALDAFSLAFSIGMNRYLQESSKIPAYAKPPDEVVKQETAEFQSRLAKLAEEHPEVIRHMNIRLEDLIGVTSVEPE
jgi:hypothetical protein